MMELSEMVGLDHEALKQLSARQRAQLRRLARYYLLPSIVTGTGAGCFVWMTEHSPVLSGLLAVAVGAVVLNLVRLLVSGSGPAPHHSVERNKRWAPKYPPLLVIGGLAAILAQPLVLVGFSASTEAAVEQRRQELLDDYEASSANGSALRSSDEYAETLKHCFFVTHRLALIWRVPEKPLLLSLGLVGIALWPLLLSHTRYLETLRAYELVRCTRARSLVLGEERRVQAEVATLLGVYGQSHSEAAYAHPWTSPVEKSS